MQLILDETYGVKLTAEGVTFPENPPEKVVFDVWKWAYFVEKYGAKAKKDAKQEYEKHWGFNEALYAEAKIITALGFEVTERIPIKSHGVPTTDQLVKVFDALKLRWKDAIRSNNVEYLKKAAEALRPMVEEWQEINDYLSKQ